MWIRNEYGRTLNLNVYKLKRNLTAFKIMINQVILIVLIASNFALFRMQFTYLEFVFSRFHLKSLFFYQKYSVFDLRINKFKYIKVAFSIKWKKNLTKKFTLRTMVTKRTFGFLRILSAACLQNLIKNNWLIYLSNTHQLSEIL